MATTRVYPFRWVDVPSAATSTAKKLVLVAGQNITLGSNQVGDEITLTINGSGGGGGAPTGAQYVTLATDAGLTSERVLTGGTGIQITDGGANQPVTLAVLYGSTGTTACVGNDARLSDARAPTAHTHGENDVVGLVADLAAKVAGTRTISTTAPLAGGGDLTANRTISIPKADSTHDGYLSQGDWATFNGKQPAGSYVATTRAINTSNGLQGGGDLSADRALSPVYGSSANTITQGNDARLSDARTPTGAAGGQLGSNYPNPDVRGLRETAGPTLLTVGAVADGQYLQRVGATIVGTFLMVAIATTMPPELALGVNGSAATTGSLV